MGRQRMAIAGIGVATVLALGATGAGATTPPAMQEVTIERAADEVTAEVDPVLKQGPTVFRFSGGATAGSEIDFAVFELKKGATKDDFLDAASDFTGSLEPLQKVGRFVVGAKLSRRFPSYTASVALSSGTYLMLDVTTIPTLVGPFTVGTASSAATAAKPAATITVTDSKISAPATLPSSGTIRFRNDGKSPHSIAMLKAATPAAAAKVALLLHQGKDAEAKKLETGEATPPLGLVSPGVTNDVVLRNVAPGSYVLADFYKDARSQGKENTKLGMETVVTVK